MRPVRRWVHSVSLGSFGFTLGSLGSFRFVGLILVCPGGRWVNFGVPWLSFGSFGVAGFVPMRPGDRWVHSVSLDSVWCTLGVVGFIRGRWVHSAMDRWVHLGSSGFTQRFARFIWGRQVD